MTTIITWPDRMIGDVPEPLVRDLHRLLEEFAGEMLVVPHG